MLVLARRLDRDRGSCGTPKLRADERNRDANFAATKLEALPLQAASERETTWLN